MVAPEFSNLGSPIEVTCDFDGALLAIEWRTTQAGAPNSDNGESLLTYIPPNGPVNGPGLSRGMTMSTSNYSLFISEVMCRDTAAFWCTTTIGGGVGQTERGDTTEVYSKPFHILFIICS